MVVALYFARKSHVSNGQSVSFKEPCRMRPSSGSWDKRAIHRCGPRNTRSWGRALARSSLEGTLAFLAFCASAGKALQQLLGVDSPLFSAMVLFKNQPFPQGFWWFSRKKDPWKNREVTPRQLARLGGKPSAGKSFGRDVPTKPLRQSRHGHGSKSRTAGEHPNPH